AHGRADQAFTRCPNNGRRSVLARVDPGVPFRHEPALRPRRMELNQPSDKEKHHAKGNARTGDRLLARDQRSARHQPADPVRTAGPGLARGDRVDHQPGGTARRRPRCTEDQLPAARRRKHRYRTRHHPPPRRRKLTTVLATLLEGSRHRSAQLYIRLGDVVTADLAVVDGKVDGSMSRRRLFPLLSTAKPILAATALTVCRDAGLSLTHLLADTIPDLAGHRRQRIRVRDVLTHQTGFPPMPTHPGLVAASWPDAFQGATQVPAGTSIKPGIDGCYQEWRYWYLLGELITRITALPVPDVVRSRVLRPLGLD